MHGVLRLKVSSLRGSLHIDTDQIYSGRYLYLTSPEEIAIYSMEDIIPDFSEKIGGEDWIIVAGKNFGCGSSREHAPRAILCAGIKAIVVESFGRIFIEMP